MANVEQEVKVSGMHKDGNAIITSVDKIDQTTWKDFVNEHWDKLMIKGTTMLVLTGVHGLPNGQLGEIDPEQIVEDQPMKEHLLKIHGQQVEDKDIKIFLMDVGPLWRQYAQTSTEESNCKRLKSLKTDLITQIKEWEIIIGRKFTLLLFAFCHTHRNVLVDLLRLDSMCSRLILEREQVDILGKRITWSDEQMRALSYVISNPQKPIILTGNYGTGKTVVATEAAKIKVAYGRTMQRESVQVIVSTGYRKYSQFVYGFGDHGINYQMPDQLQLYFEEVFSAWNVDVKVLSAEATVQPGSTEQTLEALLPLIKKLRLFKEKTKNKTIFFIDEFPKPLVDMFQFNLEDDEDLIMVVRPPKLMLTGSTKPSGLPKCLTLNRNYRNSLEICRLNRFLLTHLGMRNYLGLGTTENENWQREVDHPHGSIPVWVSLEKDVTVDEVIRYLQEQVQYRDRLVQGQFQVVEVDEYGLDWKIKGGEWKTMIVLVTNATKMSIFGERSDVLCEAITRARNHLFILTKPDSDLGYCKALLSAARHGEFCYQCDVCSYFPNENFVGLNLLEQIYISSVTGQLEYDINVIIIH